MLLNGFQLHLPTCARDAARLYQELEDVKILAGGTFLLNSLKLLKTKGTRTCAHVLSLAKALDLKGIEFDGKQVKIGAMTTVSELKDSRVAIDHLPVLGVVCHNISTNPIRNMATVGGNLTCRYTWTELGAVMITLDAAMHFLNSDGSTITRAAQDFFRNNARSESLFTHVTIPVESGRKTAYQRVKKTLHVDVPLLAVCASARMAGNRLDAVRVGINNGITFARRDETLEAFLSSARICPALADEAMSHLTAEIYDTRSFDYKKHMFRVSLKRAIGALIEGAP